MENSPASNQQIEVIRTLKPAFEMSKAYDEANLEPCGFPAMLANISSCIIMQMTSLEWIYDSATFTDGMPAIIMLKESRILDWLCRAISIYTHAMQ